MKVRLILMVAAAVLLASSLAVAQTPAGLAFLRLGTFTRSRLISTRGRPRPIGMRRKNAR